MPQVRPAMPQLCSSYMAATLSIFRCLEIQESKGGLYSRVTPSGKIIPKSTRNRAKIEQKSSKNQNKITQKCPESTPRAPKSAQHAPKLPQERPKSPQERPKSVPKAPKSHPRASQEKPRASKNDPRNHPTAPYVEEYVQTNISSQHLISVYCFVLHRWNLPLDKIVEKPLFFLGFVDVLLELSRSLEMQKISTNKRKITKNK